MDNLRTYYMASDRPDSRKADLIESILQVVHAYGHAQMDASTMRSDLLRKHSRRRQLALWRELIGLLNEHLKED